MGGITRLRLAESPVGSIARSRDFRRELNVAARGASADAAAAADERRDREQHHQQVHSSRRLGHLRNGVLMKHATLPQSTDE